MASLHRIQWIDSEIRAGRCPNARRVAGRFEISHRQAQRDFEYLRDSLGAPLVYGATERGYRYEGGANLGKPVTVEQAKALVPLVKEAKRAETKQVELAKGALAG
jgi:predicted DNA-binding transcriptional regulator YafY